MDNECLREQQQYGDSVFAEAELPKGTREVGRHL